MRRLFQHGTLEDPELNKVKPWGRFIIEGLVLAAILHGLALIIRQLQ